MEVRQRVHGATCHRQNERIRIYTNSTKNIEVTKRIMNHIITELAYILSYIVIYMS